MLIAHSPGMQQLPRRVLQLHISIGLPPTELIWFRLVRFRSPLLTESLRFPFLRVLRCFSSPAYLLIAYGFSDGSPGITRAGLPHSEIPGSQPAGGSPRLIAAIHVLHRLLVPRHPPRALSSLTFPIVTFQRLQVGVAVRDAHTRHIYVRLACCEDSHFLTQTSLFPFEGAVSTRRS